MAGQDKITRYGMSQRVLELSAMGKNTYEIAAIVTDDLQARGISDSLSQSAVSRWLKGVREERAEKTRSVVQEHIKEVVPKDLEALEEIEGWLMGIFRNQRELVKIRSEMLQDEELQKMLSVVNGGGESGDYDIKTRGNAAMMALKVIELKLKYSGILETPDDQEEAKALAREAEELLDPVLEEGIHAIGQA